jgi:HSP20 family protein
MNHFDHIIHQMDKIMEGAFDRSELGRLPDALWKPALDIYEMESVLVVLVELAGVRKKDIKVTIEADILSITGVRRNPLPTEKHTCHRIEIHQGPFRRNIKLNVAVKRDQISAQFQEGLLKIQIPKEVPA